MLAGAEQRYRDLLGPIETAFLAEFRGLSRDARCVWVRLMSRKGPVFRRDRIAYDEIPDTAGALAELIAHGFATSGGEEDAASLLALLLRSEIERIANELTGRVDGRRTKAKLVEDLRESIPGNVLIEAARRQVSFVRLRRREESRIFRLLFFGNLYQDWTELVLTDLDLWRYESYSLRTDLRRFKNRRALDDVLAASTLATEIRELLAGGDPRTARSRLQAARDRSGGWDEAAHPRLGALSCDVGRELERIDDLEQALMAYSEVDTPPARERRARVQAKLDRPYDAIALCREIEADPADESERLFAPRFRYRLQRRLGQIAPVHRARRPRRLIRVPRDDSRNIESLALETMAAEGWTGFHSENWLWRSLFGLYFWDVVFHPVPGAFEHPFQLGPLDLWQPGFRGAREDLVAGRLEEISKGAWPHERITDLWTRKTGTRNALVSWNPIVEDAVTTAAEAVPGSDIAYVFDRLSRDLRRYRRGFPDLFVVDSDATHYQLLEVKGPGDQLRPEQTGWLDYLSAGGVQAHLLAVEWRAPSI